MNFTGLHTYSVRLPAFGPVDPSIDVPFRDDVRKELAAKGWHEVASGGEIEVELSYTWEPLIPNSTDLPSNFGQSASSPAPATTQQAVSDRQRFSIVTVRAFARGAKDPSWFGRAKDIELQDLNLKLDRLDKGVSKILKTFPNAA